MGADVGVGAGGDVYVEAVDERGPRGLHGSGIGLVSSRRPSVLLAAHGREATRAAGQAGPVGDPRVGITPWGPVRPETADPRREAGIGLRVGPAQ